MTSDDNMRLVQTVRPAEGARPDRRVAVLMSGGVDSSVTAMLLQKDGWDVAGVTMKIPLAGKSEHQRSCCGMEAAYICRDLGIEHYYIETREAFEAMVIEPFRRAYSEGRTPSPCVDCNTALKFGAVWDIIERDLGISYVATGHYVRVTHTDGQHRLTMAQDRSRDQSYFLYGIPIHRLEHFLAPLGDLNKDDVRELASIARLQVARKPDSMELCFAGEGDYRNALAGVTERRGPILHTSGAVLGEHEGIANYTIGQRRGLRVATGQPLYVTAIRPADNSVVVGTMDDASARDVYAEDINVLIPDVLERGARLLGKIRSNSAPAECVVTEVDAITMSVRFDEPQFAPTYGQRIVLYDEDGSVVAGGTIARCDAQEDTL